MRKIISASFIGGNITRYFYVFLLVFLIACNLHAESVKWLKVCLSGRPVSFLPCDIEDSVSLSIVCNNIFETLAKWDESLSVPEPHLAKSWEMKEDGRVWEFTLQGNVLFHDGSVLTVDDVIKSFEENSYYKGEVEKIDQRRFKCILPDRRTNFVKSITNVNYAISKTLPDGNVVGTGPFFLKKWDPSDRIIIEAFLDYWGEKTDLDGAIFLCSVTEKEALTLMRKGKADVVDVVSPSLTQQINADNDINLSVLEGTNISYISINISRPPLNNPEFRRALNMTIDRDYIIKKIYSGQATVSNKLLPPIISDGRMIPNRIEYNPKKAKKIINKYLDTKDRRFKMIGLPFARPYCPKIATLARMIARYLRIVGLKLDYIQSNSMEDFLDKISGNDYDFAVDGWIVDSQNPNDFYAILFGIGKKGYYGTKWENKLFKSLILKARTTANEKEQYKLYHRADDIFFKEYPWITLVHSNQIGAYKKNVKGLNFCPTGELRLGNVSIASGD